MADDLPMRFGHPSVGAGLVLAVPQIQRELGHTLVFAVSKRTEVHAANGFAIRGRSGSNVQVNHQACCASRKV
jgi:hypothetical protein